MSQTDNWTTQTLFTALEKSELVVDGSIKIEMIEGADPDILITMKEFGDLPILLGVSGSQIIVDTLLWPVDEVGDTAEFIVFIRLRPPADVGDEPLHRGACAWLHAL